MSEYTNTDTVIEYEIEMASGLAEEIEYGLTCEGDDGWVPNVRTEWVREDETVGVFRLIGSRFELKRVTEERWAGRAKAEGLKPAKVIVLDGVSIEY